jgi:hypothetical protein
MARRHSRVKWLDGVETVAATLLLVMVMIVGGLSLIALVYVWRNAPPKFGSQGEWLYGGVAALVGLVWAVGQTISLIRRLHRLTAPETESNGPRIELGPEGFSVEWNPSGTPALRGEKGNWTWNVESGPVQTTFRLDEGQLATARTLRDSGLAWDAIGRRVCAEYDGLGAMEQMLYQRALEMAVNAQGPSAGRPIGDFADRS